MACNTVLLVRPTCIRNNEQTAVNNHYQSSSLVLEDDFRNQALTEFEQLCTLLRHNNVKVLDYTITDNLDTPDAHFPNNWISFHENGTVALYPMFAENRRLERRKDVLEFIKNHDHPIKSIKDYSDFEKETKFLEGTGSMVLDRKNKVAYCALSQRANKELFYQFCKDFDYLPISFTANQTVKCKREPIYHTNVMMCIAEQYALICLDSIDNQKEKDLVLNQLKKDNKTIILLSEEQLTYFCGNMLEVKNTKEESLIVMSSSAFNRLTTNQKKILEQHSKILHSAIPTIEILGGGSVRCMLAEVY